MELNLNHKQQRLKIQTVRTYNQLNQRSKHEDPSNNGRRDKHTPINKFI